MKKTDYKVFAIMGLGRYGSSVAKTLGEQGFEVIACDKSEEKVEDVSEYVTKAICCDCSDEKTLQDIGLNEVDVVIIAIASDIEASIMATLLVKEMGVKYIVAKANNNSHAKVLAKLGANKIVFPEKDMGIKTAQSFISSNFMEFIGLQDDYSIVEIKIPEKWVGKNLETLDLRRKYLLNIIGASVNGKMSLIIDPKKPLEENQVLYVIGRNVDINEAIKQ